MSSPSADCDPFDAVVRERINVAPQVDDNSSSDWQTPDVLDALDPYINDLCFTEIPTERISLFGNNVNYSIFSDHEFSGTNLMYDATEAFMLFPSFEKTMEATDSQYGASCEESQQMSDNAWFQHMCLQTKSAQDFEVSHCPIDSNEVDYSDPESFIKTFFDLSDESNSLPALVSKETSKKKHTLVLDLDETLVHSTWEPCYGVDFTIHFADNDNKDQTVYVRKRPFLEVFLKRVSEIFEVIIFTASQRCYAEKLLDVLDPDGKFFSGRRYRDSCILLDEVYTKDLTVLGLDLAKVFIIDNSPQVFRLQPDNGIPIESWFDDASDSSLMSLLPFLETFVDVDDVRPVIANKFRAWRY
ncbi:CTD small phosphatase-like protein 2 [Neltuma alba]|uniref:CTD small phosphatase-like protein 2 n=1 Tax=Neltuma alba TaxID=207710 RepID=UPI0010A3841C|nr:CTD small phosphatase-like protein 2 [Prosopis alba]